MPTPVWQPSTYYAPGSLVQPATAQPAVPTPIPNWSFESGNVEWILDANLSITSAGDHYGPGTFALQGDTGWTGNRFAEMQDFIDCTPGETITAKCQVQQGSSSAGFTSGSVYLRFYDGANILIQENEGNIVNDGSGGAWHQSTVTASAPANTAFVRIAIRMNRVGQNNPFWVDAVEWNKISQAQTGLIFKAVQALVGLSGPTEPTWPLVNGQQVVDNTVIWEAVLATRIVWQAKPILVSGAVEPAFTAVEGSSVGDNTISWRAVSRRVTDPNCPNSKIAIIGASKIYAADDDIVAYSATVNPLDWSTANDAGYVPSNLQQYGANPVAGLGLYRSNLAIMNTEGSQLWQIDEDPAQIALLDAFPVGTADHDSISPAFNDLFFAATLGFRTIGIAGGSTNMQSGDAGMPIDDIVQPYLDGVRTGAYRLLSFYYPAAGQYWALFCDDINDFTYGFIYTVNDLGKVGAWTRYEFPFSVDDWTVLETDLYLRAGDDVRKVDKTLESDAVWNGSSFDQVAFQWGFQTQYLDVGQISITKMVLGFDIIGRGSPTIEFGYNQADTSQFTPPWQIPSDSVPGQMLMVSLLTPSLAIRVTYTGDDVNRTGFEGLNLWFNDMRPMA